jgi:F-type H+-transporting ATPase subunit b
MKPRHARILLVAVLSVALGLAGPALRAQHEPAQQTETVAEPASHESSNASSHVAEHASEAHSSGHGPAIEFLGHPLSPFWQFFIRVVNFAIFFAILYLALKGLLSSAFKMRAKELEEKLTQAERDRAEGEARIAEMEAQMAEMGKELEAIMAKAEVEALDEKARIIAEARQEATAILAQTRQDIENQRFQIEHELRAMIANLAVEGARNRIGSRLQGEVGVRVIDESIKQMGGAQ